MGDEPVGVIGEVHPDVLDQFEIEQAVAVFEIDLALVVPHLRDRIDATSPPRFPAVEPDLAVVVDASVPAGAIPGVLEGSPLVKSAWVLDGFRGERMGAGQKSIAFWIRYQGPNRTRPSKREHRRGR